MKPSICAMPRLPRPRRRWRPSGVADVVADGVVEQHGVCGTMPMAARSEVCVTSRMFWPSMVMRPPLTS